LLTNAIEPRRGELQVSRLNIKIRRSSSWTRYTHRLSITLYDSLLSLVHFTRTTAPGPPQHHEIHLEDFILAIERDFFVVGIALSQTALGDQQVQLIWVPDSRLPQTPTTKLCRPSKPAPKPSSTLPSQNMARTTPEQLSKETADTTWKPQPVNHCPVIIDPEEPAQPEIYGGGKGGSSQSGSNQSAQSSADSSQNSSFSSS